MDAIGIVVSALASGAAAGLKSTAEKAIKDGYAGLKGLIQRKYDHIDLLPVESKPESRSKRESLAEDLVDAGAAGDQELLNLAKVLIDAIEKHDKTSATVVGVDIEEVKAAYLKVKKVTASGSGVRVSRSEFEGGIDIGQVNAGETGESPNP